ncbi:glycoside hydrolase family 13 protein [Schizophyllum commune]
MATRSISLLALAALLAPRCVQVALAATADDWRGRSIYQVLTDRFALPEGADTSACKVEDQTWCGGTWNTIRENLDYIQDAGFTALWISPVNQNYDGERSAYGDAYHGYWIKDISKLNDRFGTADDLKALSDELHKRDMYLMVDVVVNNVMATSTDPDFSQYYFKDKDQYHPYCGIEWGNSTSEQDCWLGDEKVPLPDLDTRNADVISGYQSWVKELVQTYNIDGLRIDAAKHVNIDFWSDFCKAAGVFCIGEVFGGDNVDALAQYQGPLDSVLNFNMYTALMSAFKIPGDLDVTKITNTLDESKEKFKDITVLGNFLENQDLPRWHNQSVDPQSLYNAMTYTFMSSGIPIVYYGQEQYFSGVGDPYNREPLWQSNYEKTIAYNLTATLNKFRNHLVSTTDWATQDMTVLTTSKYGIGFTKGEVITVLTNIGSPAQNGTQIAVKSPYGPSYAMTDVLTCQQWVTSSEGMLDVEYTAGGKPVILVPEKLLSGSGLCGQDSNLSGNSRSQDSNDGAVNVVSRLYAILLSAVLIFVAWPW